MRRKMRALLTVAVLAAPWAACAPDDEVYGDGFYAAEPGWYNEDCCGFGWVGGAGYGHGGWYRHGDWDHAWGHQWGHGFAFGHSGFNHGDFGHGALGGGSAHAGIRGGFRGSSGHAGGVH